MRATKKQITELVKYRGFEFSTLIAKLKEYGYSVNIKESRNKIVVMWSTHTHCASTSFTRGSESDEKIVCEKLRDTFYNLVSLRIRHNN